MADLKEQIVRRARALGFDAIGVARADEPLGVEHERLREFVARGMHGAMRYLAEHAEARRRIDTDDILEGAKSIVCLGRRYGRDAESEASDPPIVRTIARYARGQDYHNYVRKRVQRLAAFMRRMGPGVEARPICDIEPVMERVWAARAGLGFIGKNGLVITPGQGSYQLLGEVVTNLELSPDSPMSERCGSCTRCLDACPTSAFVAPFVLDPRRCVAYLTIEQPDLPSQELRAKIGERLFGCDDCQDVCPFNRAPPPPAAKTRAFAPLERFERLDLEDLVKLDEPGWAELSTGTPLKRAGRAGIARNAAIVAKARLGRDPGDAVAARALEAARSHEEEVVRRAAYDSGGRGADGASEEGRDGSEVHDPRAVR